MPSRHLTQRQCKTCGEYLDAKAYQCFSCGAIQRKIQEPKISEEGREAFHKKKLETMHVPPWLRAVIDAVNFCQEEIRVHQTVRWLGALCGMAMVYSAFYWMNYAAGNYFPMKAMWVRLPLALPCLIAFYLGYHYFFRAFYVVLEAVAEVVEVEKEAHIWSGVQKEKSHHKHPAKEAHHAELKLPPGIRPFDKEKDEEQRQLEAIHKALEE